MSDTDGNVFVFCFDQNGVEAIANLTAIDKEYIMEKLETGHCARDVGTILNMMCFRARLNSQRLPEIWLVKLDSSYTEKELLDLADKSPQAVANLARQGENVFGKHNPTPPVIV